jgi:Protein of unknown function (DUF3006)
MTTGVSNKVVVDRIEGDLAVLVLYDDDRVKLNVPVRCLPEGLREGDHLLMSFSDDRASRAAEKKRVDDLLEGLKRK